MRLRCKQQQSPWQLLQQRQFRARPSRSQPRSRLLQPPERSPLMTAAPQLVGTAPWRRREDAYPHYVERRNSLADRGLRWRCSGLSFDLQHRYGDRYGCCRGPCSDAYPDAYSYSNAYPTLQPRLRALRPTTDLHSRAAASPCRRATSGSLMVTVSPENGFSASLSFACSGLPSGWGCSFAPSTLSGSSPQSTNMTVSPTSSSRLMPAAFRIGPGLVSPLPLFWLGLSGKSRRVRGCCFSSLC